MRRRRPPTRHGDLPAGPRAGGWLAGALFAAASLGPCSAPTGTTPGTPSVAATPSSARRIWR